MGQPLDARARPPRTTSRTSRAASRGLGPPRQASIRPRQRRQPPCAVPRCATLCVQLQIGEAPNPLHPARREGHLRPPPASACSGGRKRSEARRGGLGGDSDDMQSGTGQGRICKPSRVHLFPCYCSISDAFNVFGGPTATFDFPPAQPTVRLGPVATLGTATHFPTSPSEAQPTSGRATLLRYWRNPAGPRPPPAARAASRPPGASVGAIAGPGPGGPRGRCEVRGTCRRGRGRAVG